MSEQKRVYIETYGCQMNEDDSDRILRLLEGLGYAGTREPREADLVIINTCSVREKPEHKVYSALGRYKNLKAERGTLIGVAGCLAQQEGQRLLARVPYLDFVLGTHAIPSLPHVLHQVTREGRRVCQTALDPEGKYLTAPIPPPTVKRVKSYVTIMQGCDHFCSYCIVPYVRGREKTRPSADILVEVRQLVQGGVREVCLLGQNVNAYGKGVPGELLFTGLLQSMEEIGGLDRIRFMTSHAEDLSEELIYSFGRLKKLCEHIHLPFQSGSDRVLKRMHRGYTRESYLEKIDHLRGICSSVSITTDVIVGFPGETDEDFQETLALIRNVRFDDLFSFMYSPRKGTRAAQFEDQVKDRVKQDRLLLLQSVQREITMEKNRSLEGSVEEVLVEGRSKQSSQEVTGRTRSNKIVNVQGPLTLVGQRVSVRITNAFPHSLRGEIVQGHPSGSRRVDSRDSET